MSSSQKAFETLSWSRSLIKPSEELDKKVKAESVVLDSEGTSAVKKMFSIESKVLDALTGKKITYAEVYSGHTVEEPYQLGVSSVQITTADYKK